MFQNRIYQKFPRMEGFKDLYQTMDGRVFIERSEEIDGAVRKGLYCAWVLVNVTEGGIALGVAHCNSTPTSEQSYGHVVTPLIQQVHYFFRAAKIALCSLRDIFPKFLRMMFCLSMQLFIDLMRRTWCLILMIFIISERQQSGF